MTISDVSTGQKELVKDRAIRLFKFLRDLAGLRAKTVRRTSEYDLVWWAADLPREAGCHFIGWQSIPQVDAGTPWVEIKKPKLKGPPPPPTNLRPWVIEEQLSDSSLESPELLSIIEVQTDEADAPPEIRLLGDSPNILMEWQQFLESQWRPWAITDRIQQRIQSQYSKLFSIYQKQKTLGENYEAVVSFGHFTWRASGYEVARHLITAQAAISFDDVRGVITVGTAADGAKLTLEQDMLDVPDRPEADDIEKDLRDLEFVMWDGQAVPDTLRGWVHRVAAEGQYEDSLTPQRDISATPTVTLAPAIVLRRRGERTIMRLFKDLIEKFEGGQQPSAGIEHLVCIMDQSVGINDGDEMNVHVDGEIVDDLYLPLPANDEQRLIVSRLQHNQGILVQGPPGTGKSHTIANLLCHLLASGKRVLVTSHTARALAVLRGKLPGQIADLCVLLLGNDLAALEGLENSVREITERYNDRNDEQSRRNIEKLEKLLADARGAEAEIYRSLRAIRESDVFKHPMQFGDYSGTLQAIADRIREREPLYGWIRGLINEKSAVPMTDAEARELLDLHLAIDDALVESTLKARPSRNEIPSPSEFSDMLHAVERTEARRASLESGNAPEIVSKSLSLGHEEFSRLRSTLSKIVSAASMYDGTSPWLQAARDDIVARNPLVWAELLTTTDYYLARVGDRGRWAADRSISGIDQLKPEVLLADVAALLEHINKGGGLGFGPFKAAPVKRAQYIVRGVRVDGRLCRSASVLEDLSAWLIINADLRGLDSLWCGFVPTPNATSAIRAAHFAGLRDKLSTLMDLKQRIAQVDTFWLELGHVDPLWTDLDNLRRVHQAFDFAWADRECRETIKPLQVLKQCLQNSVGDPSAHEVASMLLDAVDSNDSVAYAAAYSYLTKVEADSKRLSRRDELTHRLGAAAPKLLEYVMSERAPGELSAQLGSLSKAWQWAQADTWLRDAMDPSHRASLESELTHHRFSVRKHLTELAAEKAWAWCFKSMTNEQRRHLVAWQQEIKKLGKGTGKHAARHRQQARDELEGARGAVPAWVMPIYRLAETINVNSDKFDVVIIDEASQSGPDAMFLLEFAKQIIIVGDDKQIKPDVFVDQNVVEKLRRQYITDLPSSTLIGSVDTSLFEVGDLLYGGRVRLREHFRCMPEIIQFSNNLCYRSEPLIPLRQFGAMRLKPVVSTRHIRDGYQKGRPGRFVNPPEADAIVEFIVDATRDPQYSKKTFGVISLLGDDQAKLIEQTLLERLGPEEIQRRNLVCGDAYAFQGDERDVMLISMVSAITEGVHIGVLSKQSDERRFNVAASRAKDQMILFHSVTLNDLSQKCLRHRLLEYCLNPQVDPLEVAGIKLDALRELSSSPSRDRMMPPTPFDSWFEVDVCIRIMEQGYRVVPQYPIAGYQVDLMVEGMNGRIAVECDGEEWHGPEQFDRDAFRQRELERAGLHFFRPRGGEFYRDPPGCLEPLWKLLGEGGPNSDASPSDSSASPVSSVETSGLDQHGEHSAEYAEPKATARAQMSELELAQAVQKSGNNEISDDAELLDELGTGSSRLPPYREWSPRPMPDPRNCSVEDIVSGLVEIVRAEGPIVWSRAYRLYARAAGIHRVGHNLRSIFNRAAARAARQGLLEESVESSAGQMNRTVWLPSTAPVKARQRGARTADELPSTEIAEVAKRLLATDGISGDELIQRISDEFVIGRLTSPTRGLIRRALQRHGFAVGP